MIIRRFLFFSLFSISSQRLKLLPTRRTIDAVSSRRSPRRFPPLIFLLFFPVLRVAPSTDVAHRSHQLVCFWIHQRLPDPS